jgi:primosomal replication protein N
MPLSKDTLKNLLDVMQKVSLAVMVLSIALFSNVVLSHRSVEREAQSQLAQLMRIRDKIGGENARDIINNILAK